MNIRIKAKIVAESGVVKFKELRSKSMDLYDQWINVQHQYLVFGYLPRFFRWITRRKHVPTIEQIKESNPFADVSKKTDGRILCHNLVRMADDAEKYGDGDRKSVV